MPLLTLNSNRLRLAVIPEAGASIIAFELLNGDQWRPLMRPTPPEAVAQGNSSLMASFLLAPWSNRIRHGRFPFNGRTIQLRPNTPEGYAHHGDVRQRPWRVREASDRALTLTFESRDFPDINYPFPFACTARYSLDVSALISELTLTNTGAEPMPVGLGFHPYFQRALAGGEDAELQFRVGGVYPDLVPAGPAVPLNDGGDFSQRRAIGDAAYDHCFAGWDGRATIRWPVSGVQAQLVGNSTLSHLVLYAPPGKPFFALEPVSHANNGFNLAAMGIPATGVQVLGAGEELRSEFWLSVEA